MISIEIAAVKSLRTNLATEDRHKSSTENINTHKHYHVHFRS